MMFATPYQKIAIRPSRFEIANGFLTHRLTGRCVQSNRRQKKPMQHLNAQTNTKIQHQLSSGGCNLAMKVLNFASSRTFLGTSEGAAAKFATMVRLIESGSCVRCASACNN